MSGYNISVYLDKSDTWGNFKEACRIEGKSPNTVLRSFINEYSNEVLGNVPLETEIAKGMIEAKKISKGELKARKASDLLKEI